MDVHKLVHIQAESLAVLDNEKQTYKYQISLNLKHFVPLLLYICLNILCPCIYNDHHVKAVKVHKSNEVYFRKVFHPCLTNREYSRISHVHCYLIITDVY